MAYSDWVLLGGETLLAREIRELVEERKLNVTLHLAGPPAAERVLKLDDEDGTVIEPLDAALLAEADVVLLDGDVELCRQALALAHAAVSKPAVIDLTGAFEDLPQAVVRAPIWEPADRPADAPASVHALAHPAAVGLARLVEAFTAAGTPSRVVATIFEPASEHGRAGVDELHSQTLHLFNFQPLPQTLFDTQTSCTMLPRYGPAARVNLESTQQRIERHLTTLLGARGLALPSVRLVHAPVFHGYLLNVWVEFEKRVALDTLGAALTERGLTLEAADAPPISNLSVAGQSGLALGELREDYANPRALWLWAGFDNVRARAEAALLVAGLLTRGKGVK